MIYNVDMADQPLVAGGRAGWLGRAFSFPNPVNEVSARLVAGVVVVMALVALVEPWLLVVIAYGFVARALAGPRFSPLGLVVTKVVTPRLPLAPRPVAGPPKRFAQSLGAVMSVAAAVAALGFGQRTAADVLIGLIIVAATLESGFGICIGCTIFARLMRLGLVPAEVCERCNNVGAARPGTA
jgi:hypothetical protein